MEIQGVPPGGAKPLTADAGDVRILKAGVLDAPSKPTLGAGKLSIPLDPSGSNPAPCITIPKSTIIHPTP